MHPHKYSCFRRILFEDIPDIKPVEDSASLPYYKEKARFDDLTAADLVDVSFTFSQ
jgi:hypothetical protein